MPCKETQNVNIHLRAGEGTRKVNTWVKLLVHSKWRWGNVKKGTNVNKLGLSMATLELGWSWDWVGVELVFGWSWVRGQTSININFYLAHQVWSKSDPNWLRYEPVAWRSGGWLNGWSCQIIIPLGLTFGSTSWGQVWQKVEGDVKNIHFPTVWYGMAIRSSCYFVL